jgi:hypothetical protein
MAINLDHVTEQITVTDTAANADLTLVPKGTGVTKTNGGLAIQSGTGSFPSTGYGLELFNGDSGNNWIQSFNRTSSTYLTTLYNASSHQFRTSGTEQFRVSNTASAVNYVQATGGATGNAPYFSSQGSDTNISFAYTAKGTGNHDFYTSGTSFTQQFRISHTASAVNYVQVTGAATGNIPTISAQGSDTNINFSHTTKGSGYHLFYSDNGASPQFAIARAASTVNYVEVIGAATGGRPLISVQGSDTNINMGVLAKGSGVVYLQSGLGASLEASATGNANYFSMVGTAAGTAPVLSVKGSDTNIDLALTPKGTGNVRFGTHTGTADTAVSGYIEIKDSGGTIRKLAVIT